MARFGRIHDNASSPADAPQDRPLAPRAHSLVCLMGVALDSGNLGVTVESLALIGLVNKYCPDARIALLTEHPDGGAHTAQIGDRSIPVEIVNGRVDLKRPI